MKKTSCLRLNCRNYLPIATQYSRRVLTSLYSDNIFICSVHLLSAVYKRTFIRTILLEMRILNLNNIEYQL